MESPQAVDALAALAQDSRLAVYRLLVERGPEGYPAGEIGERLAIPAPTLSFHLKALARAGLVHLRRDGRFLHYSANFERMDALVAFLTENCCRLATACDAACAPQRRAAEAPQRHVPQAPQGRVARAPQRHVPQAPRRPATRGGARRSRP